MICPYCQESTVITWIHGHGQCAQCCINVDECCRGENLGDKVTIDSDNHLCYNGMSQSCDKE